MDAVIKVWVFGIVGVAMVTGGAVTGLFLKGIRKALKLSRPASEKRVPAWLIGCVERLVFTVLIALDVQGIAPGMMGWLGLKLAANWNGSQKNTDDQIDSVSLTLTAALAGLISMMFAAIGGSLIQRMGP